MPRASPESITVDDRMQRAYRYQRTAPAGEEFAEGFAPQLTPREMLALGVFGGVYLRDCRREFPAEWFADARLAEEKPEKALNYFHVFAGQPLAEWRRKGWLHPDDPRGWFQWYCRYFMGRRHPDDPRQVARWRAFARHVGQLTKACEPGDPACRPRQRQALLQWAYDSRVM